MNAMRFSFVLVILFVKENGRSRAEWWLKFSFLLYAWNSKFQNKFHHNLTPETVDNKLPLTFSEE